MSGIKTISIISIIISIISIGTVLEINSIHQSDIEKLKNDLNQQSKISNALDFDVKSAHLLLKDQQSKINQLTSNLTAIREEDKSKILDLQSNITSLQTKMTNIQKNITDINNKTESLIKIVNLGETITASTTLVPDQAKFETTALSDVNNKNWTSHYIKENLYDYKIKSICNSPTPNCYVHISRMLTVVGPAMEVDTIGSRDLGYYFIGYSDKYVVPANGIVTISGKFLKKDNLLLSGFGKNSTLEVFILGENPDIIVNKTTLLGYSDTNDFWHSREIGFKLDPGKTFRVGFGGTDSWVQDTKQYAAWVNVTINATAK